jgi:hypothetical protein
MLTGFDLSLVRRAGRSVRSNTHQLETEAGGILPPSKVPGTMLVAPRRTSAKILGSPPPPQNAQVVICCAKQSRFLRVVARLQAFLTY